VLGSLEALSSSLEKFRNPEVGVEIVSRGLGNVNESDILRAEASGAVVYGFNVLVPTQVENLARDKKVVVKKAKVIYDILDDVKAALQNLLPEEVIITELGRGEVLAIFRTEKSSMIVGGIVKEGKVMQNSSVRVYRSGAELEVGEIMELQSLKNAVREVRAGTEFGCKIKIRPILAIGDELVFLNVEKKERKIQFS
jgi:translation initiation factor IF-2